MDEFGKKRGKQIVPNSTNFDICFRFVAYKLLIWEKIILFVK